MTNYKLYSIQHSANLFNLYYHIVIVYTNIMNYYKNLTDDEEKSLYHRLTQYGEQNTELNMSAIDELEKKY